MLLCKKCGNTRNFRQHGYPTEFGLVRLSCRTCGSHEVQNTRFENISYNLEIVTLVILFTPLIILLSALFPPKHPEPRK
ncbi:MAG: hypothetical protein ACFE9L_12570 [Candidatus Hodarchaeota archaeon]